jgi:hypothetical protein
MKKISIYKLAFSIFLVLGCIFFYNTKTFAADGNIMYLFSDTNYIKYDFNADQTFAGYPVATSSYNWPGLPWTTFDTALKWPNGNVYFFKGNQYVKFNIASNQVPAGYPKTIDDTTWPGLGWTDIDAAVVWPNGKAYFFKGNQYKRYDIASDHVDAGYPKTIDDASWPGLGWTDIDTAVIGPNGKAYFFKGSEYKRYDIDTDRVDQPVYPIAGHWNFPTQFTQKIDAIIPWPDPIYCSNSYLNTSQMTVNAQYILDNLRAQGWTKNAVCGVLGICKQKAL